MKRRTFLQVLLSAGAVVAVPALAAKPLLNQGSQWLGYIKETISWNADRDCYLVQYNAVDTWNNREYYWCEFVDNLNNMQELRKNASKAFERRWKMNRVKTKWENKTLRSRVF